MPCSEDEGICVVAVLVVAAIAYFVMDSSKPATDSTTPTPGGTTPAPTTTTPAPATPPSVQTLRQKLIKTCPASGGEKRRDILYINPTNGATYDDYLFSACKAAGTCDKPVDQADAVSAKIIDVIGNKRCHCGCWGLDKDYMWNGKWVPQVKENFIGRSQCIYHGSSRHRPQSINPSIDR